MALKNRAERKSPVELQSARTDHAFKKAALEPQTEAVVEQQPAKVEKKKVDRSQEAKKNIRIEIPVSVHKALKTYMVETEGSIQQYVSDLIEESLKRRGAL